MAQVSGRLTSMREREREREAESVMGFVFFLSGCIQSNVMDLCVLCYHSYDNQNNTCQKHPETQSKPLWVLISLLRKHSPVMCVTTSEVHGVFAFIQYEAQIFEVRHFLLGSHALAEEGECDLGAKIRVVYWLGSPIRIHYISDHIRNLII